MPEPEQPTVSFGPNAWLVDEMYDQYVRDPNSVAESWREFFEDYRKGGTWHSDAGNGSSAPATVPAAAEEEAPTPQAPAAPVPQAPTPAAAPVAPAAPKPPAKPQVETPTTPLRGAAARV